MRRLNKAERKGILNVARDLVFQRWTLTSFADLMSHLPAQIESFCDDIRAELRYPKGQSPADVEILHVLHLDGDGGGGGDDDESIWGRDVDEDVQTRRKAVRSAWSQWRGGMTVDQLLTRPSRAAAFCRDVRSQSEVPYADDDILSDLLSLRKRGNLMRSRTRKAVA